MIHTDTLLDRLRDIGASAVGLEAAKEIERLQRIIDSRPAINSGLPETYIEWSRGIYESDRAHVVGHDA